MKMTVEKIIKIVHSIEVEAKTPREGFKRCKSGKGNTICSVQTTEFSIRDYPVDQPLHDQDLAANKSASMALRFGSDFSDKKQRQLAPCRKKQSAL